MLLLLAVAASMGVFQVPAAQSFGDPGFHYAVVVHGRLAGSGRRLTLSLRDLTRPNRRCSTEHPLSGCVTVDWSDFPSRPHVPRGGVFRNELAVGGLRLKLRESGALAAKPDPYSPD